MLDEWEVCLYVIIPNSQSKLVPFGKPCRQALFVRVPRSLYKSFQVCIQLMPRRPSTKNIKTNINGVAHKNYIKLPGPFDTTFSKYLYMTTVIQLSNLGAY
jgi:hypothetical protein